MENKELKEAVIALLALSKEIVKLAKDGVQVQDAVSLFAKMQGDLAFREKMLAGYQDIDKAMGEAKQLSGAEFVDLLIAILPELKDLIQEIAQAKKA